MADTENLLGGLLFWCYIASALVSTAFLLDSLVRQPGPSTFQTRQQVKIFSALALVSFSTLSFNMLHVLVQSFQQWLQVQPPASSNTWRDALATIWRWSITSTLFRDFGEAIVMDDARFLWTLAALLSTFSTCLHLSAEGSRLMIPRRWAFIALSQILPISFAQNLFYVAVLRSTGTREKRALAKVVLPRFLTVAVFILYSMSVMAARLSNRTGFRSKVPLLPSILFARLLLLTPFLLPKVTIRIVRPREGSGNKDMLSDLKWLKSFIFAAAVGLAAVQLYRINATRTDIMSSSMRALFVHPAVSALGIDFVLSALSAQMWNFQQGYAA